LKNALSTKDSKHIASPIETMDKMTDHQISAKVQELLFALKYAGGLKQKGSIVFTNRGQG